MDKVKQEEEESFKDNCRSYTWKLPNFSKLEVEKLYSETFTIGGYEWQLLVFPRGRPQDDPKGLAVYFAAADPDNQREGWRRRTSFALSAVHPNPEKTAQKNAKHTFRWGCVRWGFSELVSLADLPEYLVDDTLTLSVEAEIYNPITTKERARKKMDRDKEGLPVKSLVEWCSNALVAHLKFTWHEEVRRLKEAMPEELWQGWMEPQLPDLVCKVGRSEKKEGQG